jgi:ADP-heptose:LPS heptosyltransferase
LLVLRALGLGDFLTAVPTYRALARAFPNHRRVLAAPRALHALLPLLGGAFDAALDAAPLAALPASAARPAVAVNLHGSGPQSHRLLLATAPERFVAFAHPDVSQSSAGAAWDAREHEVVRWCRLLARAGIAADATSLDIGVPEIGLALNRRGATLVHAGAASVARRWPVERFADVARACAARGERVLLTGNARERPLALEIALRAGLPPAAAVAGETTLIELAALVAAARRVICGDTGLAHLASAYGIPSVVLFGPTAPQTWGPPQRARHRVLWAGQCGDPHAKEPHAGLLAITTAQVIDQLEDLAARYD